MKLKGLRVLAILLSFVLALLPVVNTAAADMTKGRILSEAAEDELEEEEEDEEEEEEVEEIVDYYDIYEMNGFTFEVNEDWEIEEDDDLDAYTRVIFHVDDDFSIHVAAVNEDEQRAVVKMITEEFPDASTEDKDYSHRMTCFLCGVDCPSGKNLKVNRQDLDEYTDLDSALFWFIYDKENYAKGGAYYMEGVSLFIAADCSDLTPAQDIALMHVLTTVCWPEEEEETPEDDEQGATDTTYKVIEVPAIKQNSLEIDPITPKKAEAEKATILNYSGNINHEEQEDSYSFTAPYDGRYRVEIDRLKADTSVYLSITDRDGYELDYAYCGNEDGLTVDDLEAGETYEVKVAEDYGFSTYELNIGLQKDALDISDLTELNDSLEFVGQRNVYTFEVPMDGTYRFEFAGMQNGTDTLIQFIDDLGETIYYAYCVNKDGITVEKLKAGDVYEIWVDQDVELSSYTLKIGRQKETPDVSEYTRISDSVEFTDQKNSYLFTVPADGTYRIELAEMKSDIMVKLCALDTLGETYDYGYFNNGEGLTFQDLKAGDTYEVQVVQDAEFGSYDLIIGQQKETVDIGSHTIIKDSVEYTEQQNVYAFTADEDGTYTFVVSEMISGMCVYVSAVNYLGETMDSSYLRNGDYISLRNVKAGETYEIRVTQDTDLGNYTLTVN